MSDFSFRPWQEGDDLALLQVWSDVENGPQQSFRTMLAVDSDEAPWRRTLVAEHQGIPVAAATVYETSLHNRHLWAYVEVAPDHRRNGLGTELLQRLRAEAASAPSGVTSLRAKVAVGSSGAAFAAASGLHEIQHSRTVRVEAGSVPPVPLRINDDDQPTQAIEDIATGSVELTKKFWDFYRRSHQWDPPAEISIGRVNRLFLSDEAEALGAVVLRDQIIEARREGKKGDIKAFAVSYRPFEQDSPDFQIPDDAATEVLIGYDFDYPGAREAIMQVLSLLVAQYPVTLEVDDSMEDLATMIEPLLKMGAASVEEDTLVVAEK